MRYITKECLTEILEKHQKWLFSEPGGEMADLCCADLRGAYLSGAYLCYANLGRADLCGAYLRRARLHNATLSGANLRDVDLSGADLRNADLRNAGLCGTDLCGTDLYGANLRGANLSGANLCCADLRGAYLCCADLCGADLGGVTADCSTAFFYLQCPETGQYTAFKKAGGLIVELEIPSDALRSSATSRKCRASKAKVLSITDLDGNPAGSSVPSDYDKSFVYTVGETLEVPGFDKDRWNECAPGIHHFLTRQEAASYR